MNASCHAFPKWRIFKALLATSWALGHCHLNRNWCGETSILTELRNHWRWSRQLVGPSQHKRDDQLLDKSTSAPFRRFLVCWFCWWSFHYLSCGTFTIYNRYHEGGVCSQGIVRQSKTQGFLRLDQRCLHRMLIHRITTQRSVCSTALFTVPRPESRTARASMSLLMMSKQTFISCQKTSGGNATVETHCRCHKTIFSLNICRLDPDLPKQKVQGIQFVRTMELHM